MTDLIDTTEMYLRTILELEEEGVVALRARIAERLHHSGPTVSQTVARMERDGLVIVSGDRHLDLTDEGRQKAISVMRKHRLAERLLADVIGLDWSYIHEEACRWEHVISDRVEKRLFNLLQEPHHSPYGNPIPGLEAIGGQASDDLAEESVYSLVRALKINPEGQAVIVKRLAEPAQVEPEFLGDLVEAGIVPGEQIYISKEGRDIYIKNPSKDQGLKLAPHAAEHIFVNK